MMHLEASWNLFKSLGSLLEASGSFLKPRNQFVPSSLGNLLASILETSLDAVWKPIKTFGVDAGVIVYKHKTIVTFDASYRKRLSFGPVGPLMLRCSLVTLGYPYRRPGYPKTVVLRTR